MAEVLNAGSEVAMLVGQGATGRRGMQLAEALLLTDDARGTR